MMNRDEHLAARIKQIGYEPKSAVIAINLLAKSLQPQEKVLYLLEGSIHNTLGYLIATEKRVFYAGIDRYNKNTIEHLEYDDISNIETKPEELLPSVSISITSKKGKTLFIKGCEDADSAKFVSLLNYLCKRTME